MIAHTTYGGEMATLVIKDLRKVHPDGTQAVAGIDLAIEDGEFFVLVGPSGCGKTSVLRMVAGLEPITDGEVRVDGTLVNDVPANARDVAMVFQDNVLYPHLTVGENIAFALRIAKLDKRQITSRVAETARLLQLTDVLGRYPAQLSGGQQQRAAMGRALVRTPRLLLMDEPMSNLDAKLRTETRFEIIALHRLARVTTLYVTHDQVEAMAMGDRAAVMRDGRLVQIGTPSEMYEHPVDLFVAQFIGTPPMNVVAATVTSSDGAPAVRIGPHVVALGEAGVRALPGVERMTGRRVALGFRPESVRRDPDGPIVVSPLWTERRGVDQLVTARLEAHDVRQVADGIAVSEDAGSMINVSMPARDAIDIWKPLPLAIDTASIRLFDLTTGASVCRPAAVSTTCRASTTSSG